MLLGPLLGEKQALWILSHFYQNKFKNIYKYDDQHYQTMMNKGICNFILLSNPTLPPSCPGAAGARDLLWIQVIQRG